MQLKDTLPSFELLGTDNQHHSTEAYTDNLGTTIIFTCNHCPYARAYIERISSLVTKYEPKGIGFYAISSNNVITHPADSFENMIPMGKELNLDGKYLYDESQEVATAFGAERTPEVFVFNQEKELIYQGAIDNNWENPEEVKQHYLKDALDSLLNNNPVIVPETQAVGCTIKWKTN